MSALESLQVFQALNRSPHARLEACAELGDGLSAALWSNHHDSQDYQAPGHHTLSCYIGGGTGTFRRDQPGTKGGPDKLCILPAEHQSAWPMCISARRNSPWAASPCSTANRARCSCRKAPSSKTPARRAAFTS